MVDNTDKNVFYIDENLMAVFNSKYIKRVFKESDRYKSGVTRLSHDKKLPVLILSRAINPVSFKMIQELEKEHGKGE